MMRSFSSRKRELVHLLFEKVERCIAHVLDFFTQRIICRTIVSMCLSLMLTPCKR